MPRKPNPQGNRRGRPEAERRLRQADRLARILRVLQLLQSRGVDAKLTPAELEVAQAFGLPRPRRADNKSRARRKGKMP
jgi:hypothetical protein